MYLLCIQLLLLLLVVLTICVALWAIGGAAQTWLAAKQLNACETVIGDRRLNSGIGDRRW
jgi:hypothetical protein